MVEDNRSEINGIPFVTYFVTNYLRDPTESREHECLLKEQLIKDLELLGNAELELVDDSAAAAGNTSLAAGPAQERLGGQAATKRHLQQHQPAYMADQPPVVAYLYRSAASGANATRRLLPLSDALTETDKTGPLPLTKDVEGKFVTHALPLSHPIT